MSRPQSRYVRVDPQNPEAASICDRCGFWVPLRELTFQQAWAGSRLYDTGIFVCSSVNCLDIPFEQNRTIILPPDPPPIFNARVPNFAYEEQTVRIVQHGGAAGTMFAAPNSQPPWNAGPQVPRSLQGGTIARIIQLNTSS